MIVYFIIFCMWCWGCAGLTLFLVVEEIRELRKYDWRSILIFIVVISCAFLAPIFYWIEGGQSMTKPIALRDTVSHLTSDIPTMGIVLAMYPITVDGKEIMQLDVQVGNDVYWTTPMENWKHVETEGQREGWGSGE